MKAAPHPPDSTGFWRPGVRYMLLSALTFSVMGLLVKRAGENLPFEEIVMARAVVSLVLSGVILKHAGVSPWGENRRILVLRGFFGFAGLMCVYYALTRLPLADATVLQYMHPVFTAILAALFLGERAGYGLAAALGLSIGGVLLVTRPDAIFGVGETALATWPVIVALLGAFFSASAYVVVRYLGQGEHPHVIVFYFPLVTIPAVLPFVIVDFVWPTGEEWLLLLGVGVFTQLGQVSITRGLLSEPAGRATAIGYVQVLLAAAWGYLFFSEAPDAFTGAGALLILGGTVLAVRSGSREAG